MPPSVDPSTDRYPQKIMSRKKPCARAPTSTLPASIPPTTPAEESDTQKPSCYRCCLPALAGLAGRSLLEAPTFTIADKSPAEQSVASTRASTPLERIVGYRAPLAPRRARPSSLYGNFKGDAPPRGRSCHSRAIMPRQTAGQKCPLQRKRTSRRELFQARLKPGGRKRPGGPSRGRQISRRRNGIRTGNPVRRGATGRPRSRLPPG